MSRKIPLGLIVLTLALAILPIGLAAQQTQTELREQLESLRIERIAAQTALSAREESDRRALRERAEALVTLDTLRIGLTRVVTPIDQVDVTRELFTEVWEEHFSQISASPALDGRLFTFQWSDEIVPIYIEGAGHPINLDTNWTRTRSYNAKTMIREAIASVLSFDLSYSRSQVSAWVAGNPFRAPEMERVYRLAATRRARVNRSCLEGDTDACARALVLTIDLPLWSRTNAEVDREALLRSLEEYDDQLMEHIRSWYTPEERQALIRGLTLGFRGRADVPAWNGCVHEDNIPLCDELLGEGHLDVAPLSSPVRENFLAYAIEQGGQGAWSRLVERPDLQPAEAIEYAAAIPIDQLVEGWQARLVANQPDLFEHLVPRGALAFAWVLLFSTLAMRSTRWRLG